MNSPFRVISCFSWTEFFTVSEQLDRSPRSSGSPPRNPAGKPQTAAQDTVANLFGAVAVFLDKPFYVGDRIKVEGVEGAVEDVEGPFAVEVGVWGGLDGVGGAGAGGVGGFVREGFGGVAGAAFLGVGLVALVLEEVFDGAEEVGAEAAEGGVGAADISGTEEAGEEFLGELAGGVFGAAFGAEEAEDGLVVGVAEVGEGGAAGGVVLAGALNSVLVFCVS